MKAVFPGSFCPPTMGHTNIIERASKLFDQLIVVIGVNSQKTYAISANERKILLEKATAHLKNVKVEIFDGFLVDFCKENAVDVMIKSARNSLDLQEILDIERLCKPFWSGETVVVLSDKNYENISSSLVREMIAHKKDITGLVPELIKNDVLKLLS